MANKLESQAQNHLSLRVIFTDGRYGSLPVWEWFVEQEDTLVCSGAQASRAEAMSSASRAFDEEVERRVEAETDRAFRRMTAEERAEENEMERGFDSRKDVA